MPLRSLGFVELLSGFLLELVHVRITTGVLSLQLLDTTCIRLGLHTASP